MTLELRVDYADAPGHRSTTFRSAADVRDHVSACAVAGLQNETQRVDVSTAFDAHTRGGWAAAGDGARPSQRALAMSVWPRSSPL
ncbi:MAG: hypothetical protein ACRCXL_14260 [Dermatophilaceae bacterium]